MNFFKMIVHHFLTRFDQKVKPRHYNYIDSTKSLIVNQKFKPGSTRKITLYILSYSLYNNTQNTNKLMNVIFLLTL